MIEHKIPKEHKRVPVNWLACVVLVGTMSAASALAQTYPLRPVRLLVSFGVGGATDITTRLVAQKMSESMRQQFIVDNRPSAGGIVATDTVVRAEPDGYTLLVLGSGHAVSVSLMKSLPYDVMQDLQPISSIGFFAFALLVNADSQFRSVTDLVASAKTNPDKFNIGITTIGATHHVAAELFKSMTGLSSPAVPFRTTAALIGAVRSNEAQVIVEFIAPVLPQIKSGALRALAVTSDRRFAGLPDVPTVAEAGIPGYEASAWIGVAAPVKTRRVIVDRLNREINAAIGVPEIKQRLQDLGVDARGTAPEGFRELVAHDIAKWKTVIEKAKIERQ